MMRANARSKSIIALSLIFLLAILLFSAVFSVGVAAADSATYLSAEVTLSSGDFIPSGFVYDNNAVNLSFIVYSRADQSAWGRDDALSSTFELRYHDDVADEDLLSAPSAVGAYTVSVVAKDSSLSGYYSNDLTPIVKGSVIGSVSFRIYTQNLYLYNAVLDAAASSGDAVSGAGEILLPDSGSYDYYPSVTVASSNSLYLGSTEVPSAKYTVTVEYLSGISFAPTTEIKKVGTYRLKVTIDSSVDLSLSEGAALPTDSGDNHIYYRVFSVTCETLSFALDSFLPYADETHNIKLNAASLSKLSSIAGTSYETALLYYPSMDGVARSVASDTSDHNLYHPTEAGTYAYRVIFTDKIDTYGITKGDYVDISFSILPLPYVIRYFNNENTEITKGTIIYSGSASYPLNPVFYDLNGDEIDTVYTDVGNPKYSVSYKKSNDGGASWSDSVTPKDPGLYKVLIHFDSTAMVGTYQIHTDIDDYVFRIAGGSLEVDTSEKSYYLPVGETSIPTFTFKSQAGDESANVGAYTVNYFTKGGTSLGTTAPTAVGDYVYELRITNAITDLGVEAGTTYRGSYSIIYRPLEVIVAENVTFRDALTHVELLNSAASADFDIEYFERSGNIYKTLDAEPTIEGQYAMRLVTKRALEKYRVAVGDEYVFAYAIAGSKISVSINPSSIDLTYDGGVKVPSISFANGASPVELNPLEDYQVAYYHWSGSEWTPCKTPILAGNYRCVVTFLQDDPRGMVAGAYERRTFTIAPAQYDAVFTVSGSSVDLVYDGREKIYDVAFTYKSRPITVGASVKYATSTGDFGNDAFTNVGKYRAKVVLDDDKSGSLIVRGATNDFSILPLSLTAIFKVPLGYNRMWVDDDTIVAPTVEYLCGNGRFAGSSLTASALANSPYSISIGETKSYYCSENKGISYDIPREPKLPGDYNQSVTLSNANVVIVGVQSIGDDNGVVQDPALDAGKASQRFTVTPREVLVRYTYDASEKDAIYYTHDDTSDDRTLDRKGVKENGIAFYAYTKEAHDYATDVSAAFANDFKVYYLISSPSGVVQPGTTPSEEKPYEKAHYVARVMMEPDGADDEYLSRYTFKDGKNIDGAMGESPLEAGCYVDDLFQIKDQNKIDVVFNMPTTFADDGNLKTISAVFYNNFATVDFVEGEGKDYRISYFRKDADGNIVESNYTSFKDVGTYYFLITFLKDNVAYRLNSYAGEYSGEENIYIKSGDTITYEFTVFSKREMNVSFVAPTSLYYDDHAKPYAVRFSVREDDVDCTVTLTEGTHYSIRYYAIKSGAYSLLASAPVDPGDYAVEAVFIKDLLDYTYEKSGKTILVDQFYSVKDSADPPEGKIVSPNTTFTIAKAVLVVGGITANDKSFDNTNTATFDARHKTLTTKYGANVKNLKPADLSGNLKGSFASAYPGTHVVTLDENGKYAFPNDGYDYAKYYELEYEPFSATISKAVINVRLTDGKSTQGGSTILVEREYNPFAIESTIPFDLEYDESLLTGVFSTAIDLSKLTVGALSYLKNQTVGNAVGEYPIIMNDLALNDDAVGGDYVGKALSELFYLDLEKECYYKITPKLVTLSVTAGQDKVYGDSDPESFNVEITSGRLIYGDRITYKVARRSGENYGAYLIELSDVKVYNSSGDNVSANYTITLQTEYFHILKRKLLIVPANQSATYKTGFSYSGFVKISDVTRSEEGVDVTSIFLSDPTLGHDRLTGKLSYVATNDPLKFLITQGSMTSVVNALSRDVTNNYVITFDTTPKYYTIEQVNIDIKLNEKAVLQKYYGDKEPIITFDIDEDILKGPLKNLTIASNSSVGREAGESVGTYYLKSDNSMHSFFVYDAGIDVTDYFTFTVKKQEENTWRVVHDDVFTILPRPIIVTVEEATYEYSGRDIVPEIKYLNANGSKLSATLREDLASKVNIALPENLSFTDGENSVTPVIVGESDPNYQINLQAGTINVIYLQNVLTITPLDVSDAIYEGNEYLFSGIMLYKSVKFYKIDTASGEQPSRELSISLPIDENVTGDGLVVVALRQDGSSKAFAFTQVGQTIVYEDNGAYYVAIAEVQEWFYAIWGLVIILALVGIYYLIRLIIFLVKRHRKKVAAAGPKPEKEKKKKKKKGAVPEGAFTPTSRTQEPSATAEPAAPAQDADSLFSDTAVTDTAPTPAASSAPAETPETTMGGDDLFTDVAPTDAAVSVTPTPSAPADTAPVESDLFSEHPVTTDSAPVVAAPVTATPTVEETPKAKKDKKDKKGKADKADDANAPKGFMPKGFKPKGDKSAVYAPTRSFTEDLFNEESGTDNGDSLLSDSAISDNAVVIPPSAPNSGAGDDELVVSRGGGFSLEDDIDENDPEGKKKKKDDDQA